VLLFVVLIAVGFWYLGRRNLARTPADTAVAEEIEAEVSEQ